MDNGRRVLRQTDTGTKDDGQIRGCGKVSEGRRRERKEAAAVPSPSVPPVRPSVRPSDVHALSVPEEVCIMGGNEGRRFKPRFLLNHIRTWTDSARARPHMVECTHRIVTVTTTVVISHHRVTKSKMIAVPCGL